MNNNYDMHYAFPHLTACHKHALSSHIQMYETNTFEQKMSSIAFFLFMYECAASHRISPADGVGYMAAKCSQPGAFNRFLSRQLEAEQQVLLFSRRANHQGECIHTL